MITRAQHKKICEKIFSVRSADIPVYTHTGIKVIGVNVELGEIELANQTKITWRSYSPNTKLRMAWEKFEIRSISMWQVKRAHLVHSNIQFTDIQFTEHQDLNGPVPAL